VTGATRAEGNFSGTFILAAAFEESKSLSCRGGAAIKRVRNRGLWPWRWEGTNEYALRVGIRRIYRTQMQAVVCREIR